MAKHIGEREPEQEAPGMATDTDRGKGSCCLILKPLSLRPLKEEDRIYGVVKVVSSINSGGRQAYTGALIGNSRLNRVGL